ncbi:MAG: hypothetical protein WD906_07340 [Anaerolineales bacterium]
MTSVRERLRRWWRPNSNPPPNAASFSYRVFWTREVRSWLPERRRGIQKCVQEAMASPTFVANELGRRYRIDSLDGIAHSGASLAALSQVLTAFESTPEDSGGVGHG